MFIIGGREGAERALLKGERHSNEERRGEGGQERGMG